MGMLIDTHAHFCDAKFDADREAALERAARAGVQAVVEIGEHPDGWARAKDLAAGHRQAGAKPRVFWTAGCHPHYAGERERFDFDAVMPQGAERCVAVGEIGLDYAKSAAGREDQIALFRKALEFAGRLGKPVVIHCRDAQADTLRTLRSFFSGLSSSHAAAGVIHCFSGDLQFAEGCLDLGFYLGVDGPVTYPGAKGLRAVLSQVPLDRIVLETDAPYLPPQPFRGKRNESAHLVHVADGLAELFQTDAQRIGEVTSRNAQRLFRMQDAP